MYRYLDALVLRAAVCAPGTPPSGWPDLTEQGVGAESWRPWLQEALSASDFAAALEQASPVLSDRVRAICNGVAVGERETRRVVVSVMRYLLRAGGRATPYGLFAGVAPANLAHNTAVRLGDGHRAVARVPAEWLNAVVDHLEADPHLRPHLMVRANNLLHWRDDQIVLGHRANQASRKAPMDVWVRRTEPVHVALSMARAPIRLGDLASELAAECRAAVDTAHTLLAELVSQRLLLTQLRPTTTSIDPLVALTACLEQILADAGGISRSDGNLAGVRSALDALRTIRDQWAQHGGRGEQRERLAALPPSIESPVAIDLRVDIDLRLPHAVAVEAAKATAVLTRLAVPVRTGGWAAWHSRFLERFGPHALVPVRDAVDADIGLGYPAGYRGAPSAVPAAVTPRDRKLLALAQEAALRHQHEIVLDEATIRDLAGEEPVTRVGPSTELTVIVHARNMRQLDRGHFRLAVVGVSRNAGTTTGRFLDLFDPADRARFAAEYAALPTTTRGALIAQVSASTPYTVTEELARAPLVMAHTISLGEYHDTENAPGGIPLDDIAVTADADRVSLVSISRRRAVEPFVFNAVEQVHYALPIVRFLAEATTALGTVCAAGFDWGTARSLPFLPAVRYGRTVLSPARWLLSASDLPGPAASWGEWSKALTSWLDGVGCAHAVYLGEGDQRIGLDLAEPAHQALLRDHLARTTTAVLRAAPPPDAAGWIGGFAHEVVIPLVSTIEPAPPPRLLRTASVVDVHEHGRLPGCGDLYVKLYGHPDRQTRILTGHMPSLLDRLRPQDRWWFLRYGDPEPHLRLRLTEGASIALVGEWAHELRRAGLIARVQLDTDYPETTRFGGPAAIKAAEDYFAADSAAALAQLAATDRNHAPDVRAMTAASLVDITSAIIGDRGAAMRWLIDHTRPHRPAPPRDVYDQAVRLVGPERAELATLTEGSRVRSSWQRRHRALATYRTALQSAASIAPVTVLPDLLHLHHTRVIGPDPDSERTCLHLARAAALSWTARARSRA